MIPFLEKIADRLLRKFPHNMEDVAVVLPSKRAVVFLRHYLSQKIEKPIFLPDFYSIEEFIEDLSGLKVLDNISLQFRLYETYLKYPPKKQDTFAKFLGWSNVLVHDFNDIDRNLIDAKSVYTNLTEVKELESWSVQDWSFSNSSLTTMQTDYISFFESILTWYNNFSFSLLEENLAYQGLAYRIAAENIRNLEVRWEKVWFVGLNALTKSEQAIIDYLKKEDVARVFWDADKFYYDNPLHEAGSFLREQRERWSEIDFEGVGDYYKNKKEVFDVIACPKNISQAKAAAQVITSLSKDDLENSKTAIVLADEKLLYPVLHNLPSEIKQLNVTMGSPLKSTPLFTFVNLIFNMQNHILKYKRDAFYYKDIIALVEHAYFSKIVDARETELFKRFIVEQNLVFISERNIRDIFTNDLIIALFSIWRGNNDAINVLNKLIEHLKISLVGRSATVESEVLSTFFKNITILKILLDDYDFVLDLKTFQIVMQQLIAQEVIPFKGEPLRGVQLMGILETRTLDFDNVIMLGVNEGKLPQARSINSFIPYDMKKYFGIPTYSESDAVFSYHFYRLLQRANNISLIYNSEIDNFGSGEKSRFITQLLAEYDGEIKEYVYKGPDLVGQNIQTIVIDSQEVESKIRSWGSKGVSPSALNIYKNCSLHFYYHYLAGIRINDEIEEYADATTIGISVHNALDRHYPIGVLTEKYIINKTDSILVDIENNFIEMLSHQAMKEGKNYLSLQIAQQLTRNFLQLEKELIIKYSKNSQNIKIIEKEIELDYNLVVNGINFRLRGTVDRVDFKGNTLRIIDYKTGNVEQRDLLFTDFDELINDPSKSKVFQLLMYAYLYLKKHPNYVDTDVIAGNFSFKNLKSGLLKVGMRMDTRKSEVLKINQNVLDKFELQLKALLSKITKNSFSSTPHLDNCRWCEYKINRIT